MRYRKLGNTGLIVRRVALGTMQFGGKMNRGNLGRYDTTRMVKLALGRGINFIDTADVYRLGEGETLVGDALKEIDFATRKRFLSCCLQFALSGLRPSSGVEPFADRSPGMDRVPRLQGPGASVPLTIVASARRSAIG